MSIVPQKQRMSLKIQFENVSKSFLVNNTNSRRRARIQHITAMEDFNLDVKAGELLVVVGPSGCGKSTMLDLLMGLTKPSSGRILLDGKAITGPGFDRGIVLQQHTLIPWRTAVRNVEFGLEAKGIAKRKRREIAERYLHMVGLSRSGNRYPHQLSGGMKQRVAIARALAFDPDVLLMDEPFAAVDAHTRELLQSELLRIWEQSGKTIIFITHSIDEAVYLGDRVAVMTSQPGRIKAVIESPIECRTSGDDLRANPMFVEIRHEIWSLLREEVRKSQEQPTSNS